VAKDLADDERRLEGDLAAEEVFAVEAGGGEGLAEGVHAKVRRERRGHGVGNEHRPSGPGQLVGQPLRGGSHGATSRRSTPHRLVVTLRTIRPAGANFSLREWLAAICPREGPSAGPTHPLLERVPAVSEKGVTCGESHGCSCKSPGGPSPWR